jgi:hypothetical protein
MLGVILHSLNTPSWPGSQFEKEHRDNSNFIIIIIIIIIMVIKSRRMSWVGHV